MISKYTFNGITWVDLQSPTPEEVFHLVDEFSIPPLMAEEFVSETVRPKVDLYKDLIFLVLHFPIARHANNNKTEQEIDFVIGKNFLITIHYELVNPLHKFSKKFEMDALLDKGNDGHHSGHLFYRIIKQLYKNVMIELDTINPDLRKIEHAIFEGKEKDTVRTISNLNKHLIDYRQSMRFHHETLKSFELAGKKFFEPEFSFYLESIIGEYNKIKSILDNQKETLTDLRETNDSLLSSKTNETMKMLTVITFLFTPVTIITGLFMMNTEFIIIKTYTDFYIVIGASLMTSIIIFIYFKLKKWL